MRDCRSGPAWAEGAVERRELHDLPEVAHLLLERAHVGGVLCEEGAEVLVTLHPREALLLGAASGLLPSCGARRRLPLPHVLQKRGEGEALLPQETVRQGSPTRFSFSLVEVSVPLVQALQLLFEPQSITKSLQRPLLSLSARKEKVWNEPGAGEVEEAFGAAPRGGENAHFIPDTDDPRRALLPVSWQQVDQTGDMAQLFRIEAIGKSFEEVDGCEILAPTVAQAMLTRSAASR